MKAKLLFTAFLAAAALSAGAQCHFIPSTSTSTDTLSYSFSGGSFQSYGCAPIDPTYWLSGSGGTITVTFVNPQYYPSIRVWGMNDDDSATISVNSVSYPLNSSSASYDPKVVCGLSPGPDGVIFANGKLVGANTNGQGNYSYQDVYLHATNVTTITITGVSGAGWGFAGVSVDCVSKTAITQPSTVNANTFVYPNPFSSAATLNVHPAMKNATLSIYNLSGQLVRSVSNISGDLVTISRNGLPAGVYFAQLVQDGNVTAVEKMVITD